jgi:molybdopterin-guanine dinucleotide biosynthesis protein A
MLGVILCGGQSSRMGQDKGLIQHDGKSWAAITKEKLAALGIHVKLSVNANQYAPYAASFGTETLLADNNKFDVAGPLLGLLSFHDQFPDEDLFLLACDIPAMQVSLLSMLFKQHQAVPGSDAYVFSNNGFIEPMCGIYCVSGLQRIRAQYNRGELSNFSMKRILSGLTTDVTNVPRGHEHYFRNMNTPGDIDTGTISGEQ